MNYSEIKYCDIANGIGIRTSLFVSGCRNKCVGCFNPETWDFNGGIEFIKESAGYDDKGNLKVIYFKDEICGFAIHLVKKA